MSEIKKINVVVKCDTVVFGGIYYEKGKTIVNFPYVEEDHKNLLEPVKVIEEKAVVAEAPVEEEVAPAEKKAAPVPAPAKAPVKKGKK